MVCFACNQACVAKMLVMVFLVGLVYDLDALDVEGRDQYEAAPCSSH